MGNRCQRSRVRVVPGGWRSLNPCMVSTQSSLTQQMRCVALNDGAAVGFGTEATRCCRMCIYIHIYICTCNRKNMCIYIIYICIDICAIFVRMHLITHLKYHQMWSINSNCESLVLGWSSIIRMPINKGITIPHLLRMFCP